MKNDNLKLLFALSVLAALTLFGLSTLTGEADEPIAPAPTEINPRAWIAQSEPFPYAEAEALAATSGVLPSMHLYCRMKRCREMCAPFGVIACWAELVTPTAARCIAQCSDIL